MFQHTATAKPLDLIKDWKDLMTAISDKQSVIAALKDSIYANNFRDKIEPWEKRLGVLTTAVGDLNVVQRKWLYLEPIFSRGALPSEQSRFKRWGGVRLFSKGKGSMMNIATLWSKSSWTAECKRSRT